MSFEAWCTFAGVLLVGMALTATLVGRLPISSSIIYLGLGAALSPLWLNVAALDALEFPLALERLAEFVVVLSLFTSGLKMGAGWRDGRWGPPVRLAVGSMVITVALLTAAGHWVLGLPVAAAVLLGAILAPTDPVLAAEVQVEHAGDRDRLRFALTGEAGLNDGTAFPFVMLALGMLGLHDLGELGWRWIAVDVVWAVAIGVSMGAAVGWALGKLVLYLRRTHGEALGMDEFLALGTIALSYGLALQAHGYGFLAVFAAAFVLRQVERRETALAASGSAGAMNAQGGVNTDPGLKAEAALIHPDEAVASHSESPEPRHDANPASQAAVDAVQAPAFLAHAMLRFNEQIESIGEVIAVLVVGMLLWTVEWRIELVLFIAVALLVVRPVAVLLGLAGSRSGKMQRGLIAWFGIRGIGSIYYLMYAVNHGLPERMAADLTTVTLAVIFVSIVVHGVSVTPLIGLYNRSRRRRP